MIKVATPLGDYSVSDDLKTSGPDAEIASVIDIAISEAVEMYSPGFGALDGYIAAKLTERPWITSASAQGFERPQGDLVF